MRWNREFNPIFWKGKNPIEAGRIEREWVVLGRNAHDLRRLAEPASNVSRGDAGRPENVSIINNSDWPEAEKKMMKLRGELATIGE